MRLTASAIVLLLLQFMLPAYATDHGRTGGAEPAVSTSQKKLSPAMQALLGEIRTPQQALDEARKYQLNDQFGLAKLVLEHGLEMADESSELAEQLNNELEYEMPMLQVREWLISGRPQAAEKKLDELARQFVDNKRRLAEIGALRATLPQSVQLRAMQQKNERGVTDTVRKVMQDHYRRNGEFPRGYTELNRLLPVGDRRLQNYEVIFFRSNPNAYRIVLRNRDNPDNYLSVEATGLIR